MVNKQAFKRSFWASISRVLGVSLGVFSGIVLHHLMGNVGWTVAIIMAAASFVLMMYSEYSKERTVVKDENDLDNC